MSFLDSCQLLKPALIRQLRCFPVATLVTAAALPARTSRREVETSYHQLLINKEIHLIKLRPPLDLTYLILGGLNRETRARGLLLANEELLEYLASCSFKQVFPAMKRDLLLCNESSLPSLEEITYYSVKELKSLARLYTSSFDPYLLNREEILASLLASFSFLGYELRNEEKRLELVLDCKAQEKVDERKVAPVEIVSFRLYRKPLQLTQAST